MARSAFMAPSIPLAADFADRPLTKSQADTYRDQAAECIGRADRAVSRASRLAWLQSALQWRALADGAERSRRMAFLQQALPSPALHLTTDCPIDHLNVFNVTARRDRFSSCCDTT